MNKVLDASIFTVSSGICALSTYGIESPPPSSWSNLFYALAAFLTAVGATAIAAVRIIHIIQHIRAGTRVDDAERPSAVRPPV